MEMIYCGVMEQDLKTLEKNLNKLNVESQQRKYFNKVMDDVYRVMDQNGYQKCTEIIKRMFDE